MNEGVIKYRCEWTREPLRLDQRAFQDLTRWRTVLRRSGLLGILTDGIGFGNLSVRVPGKSHTAPPAFLITGSQTGGLETLDPNDYALVTGFRIEENYLRCTGMTQASSESLSHAAIYQARADSGAVIHIHSRLIWESHAGILPTTAEAFEYGTPALAQALVDTVGGLAPGEAHAVVMGGHKDGLMIFAPTLDEAGGEVLRLMASLGN